MFLLTASEVVLATAIIMGLSALVTIMLRLCTRQRSPRTNATDLPQDFITRGGIRVSLTSLQQRVMSKLRDRPPRYETRHNYEYQRRERGTRIPVLNPAAIRPLDGPPPSYETGDSHSVGWWMMTQRKKKNIKMCKITFSIQILGSWTSARLHNYMSWWHW